MQSSVSGIESYFFRLPEAGKNSLKPEPSGTMLGFWSLGGSLGAVTSHLLSCYCRVEIVGRLEMASRHW